MIPSQWLTLFCVWSLRRRERFPLSEKYWDLRNFWWVGQSVRGCRNIRKEWSEGRRGSQGGFPGLTWVPRWLSAAPTAEDILVRMVFGHGLGSKTTGLKSKTHIWAIINCHGLPVKNWKGVDGTVARCLQLCEDLFFDLLTKHVCYCLFCKQIWAIDIKIQKSNLPCQIFSHHVKDRSDLVWICWILFRPIAMIFWILYTGDWTLSFIVIQNVIEQGHLSFDFDHFFASFSTLFLL